MKMNEKMMGKEDAGVVQSQDTIEIMNTALVAVPKRAKETDNRSVFIAHGEAGKRARA